MKDRDGDQRRGSEWELIKILQRELGLCSKIKPKIPVHTQANCQDRVVTMDLPILGTILEGWEEAAESQTKKQSTQLNLPGKDGQSVRQSRTARQVTADSPTLHHGRSVLTSDPTRDSPSYTDGPSRHHGRSDPHGQSEHCSRTVRQTSSNKNSALEQIKQRTLEMSNEQVKNTRRIGPDGQSVAHPRTVRHSQTKHKQPSLQS